MPSCWCRVPTASPEHSLAQERGEGPRAIAVLDLSVLEAMEGRRVLFGLSRNRNYPWRCRVGCAPIYKLRSLLNEHLSKGTTAAEVSRPD